MRIPQNCCKKPREAECGGTTPGTWFPPTRDPITRTAPRQANRILSGEMPFRGNLGSLGMVRSGEPSPFGGILESFGSGPTW